jgi:hypothetical protein
MPNFFLKLCYSSCSSSFGMGAGYIKKKDPDPSGKREGRYFLPIRVQDHVHGTSAGGRFHLDHEPAPGYP